MKFLIITPSLNQLAYLKRCVASVADQIAGDRAHQGRIEVHHHVQDGGSTDGTIEFLQEYMARQSSTAGYQLTFASEADEGMYDALNKGFERSFGDIFAWLNCDEQYLPGALGKVARHFAEHSGADMVYGDALMVDPEGRLLTYRKNPPLRRAYVLADHLYTQSAAMFFRSRIFTSGLRFNTAWKAVGDCDFVIRAMKAGFRPAQMSVYLAACIMTGENLSRKQTGVEELQSFRRTVALRYRLGRPIWNLLRHSEKFMRGGFRQAVPLEYDLYPEDSNIRKKFTAQNADFRFKWDAHD